MAKKIKPPRDPKAEKAERKAEKAAALAEANAQTQTAEQESKTAEEEALAAAAAQDEFQARGVELADHVHDHPGKVLALLGSIVLAGLIYGIYTVVDKSDNTKASAAYAEAIKLWEAPLKAADDGADASADKGPSFKDATERAKAAQARFIAVAKDHRGTGASALAWMSAGHASLKLGDNDEAAKDYEAFLFAAKDNDPLRFAGYAGLATALEGKGDTKGAIDALEKLVLLADKVGEDDALLQLGRLYQKQGDVETARKRLERLKSDFAESALRARADELLATLGPPSPASKTEAKKDAKSDAAPAAPVAPASDAK
jgi:tetratricopeptide (TPR) repeat protein